MNFLSNLLFRWYLFLTIFAFFGATPFEKINLIVGVLFMWLLYLIFLKAKIRSGHYYNLRKIRFNIHDKLNKYLPLLAVGSVFLALYLGYYYTNHTLDSLIVSVSQKNSVYYEYQEYFSKNELSYITIGKLPAVISMALLKFFLLYSYISLIVLKKDITRIDYLCLVIISISYLLFSFYRGTSFEGFEIMILLWFSLSLRFRLYDKKKYTVKVKVLLLVTLAIFLSLYSYNYSARYGFEDVIHAENSYLSSFIYMISPGLADLSYKLSGYFVFGFNYMSIFIQYLWLSSFESFVYGFIPGGYDIIGVSAREKVSEYINIGAMWTPDMAVYFLRMGVVILLLLVSWLGGYSKTIFNKIYDDKDFNDIYILYFIFLQMISFPVGNYLTISSSNVLNLIFAIILKVFTGRSSKISAQ
jgi:hypothetical protein